MLTTLVSQAYGLFGRLVPLLVALQDAPRAPGGGGAPAPAGGGGGGGAAAGPAGLLQTFAIPLLLFGFLYFVMIRPMNKQRKEQDSLQKSIKKGDKVVTTSGIIATVSAVEDQFITLEISERVRVKFLRESVARKFDPAAAAEAAKAAADKAAGASTATAEAKK